MIPETDPQTIVNLLDAIQNFVETDSPETRGHLKQAMAEMAQALEAHTTIQTCPFCGEKAQYKTVSNHEKTGYFLTITCRTANFTNFPTNAPTLNEIPTRTTPPAKSGRFCFLAPLTTPKSY